MKEGYFSTTVFFFFHKALPSKGIQRLNDLLDSHGLFFSFENFKNSYGRYGVCCTFLDDAGLLVAIPKDRKNAISVYVTTRRQTNH